MLASGFNIHETRYVHKNYKDWYIFKDHEKKLNICTSILRMHFFKFYIILLNSSWMTLRQ